MLAIIYLILTVLLLRHYTSQMKGIRRETVSVCDRIIDCEKYGRSIRDVTLWFTHKPCETLDFTLQALPFLEIFLQPAAETIHIWHIEGRKLRAASQQLFNEIKMSNGTSQNK